MLSALAPTMLALIAARVVQGLGGGGLRAVSLAVVGDILPPRERGRVQGYLSTAFATANVIGPVLGGLFSSHLSWHWIFWINLPLGAAAFAMTYLQLRRLPRPTRRPRIDWLGAVLILLAFTPFLLGITYVQRAGSWLSPAALGCFVLGAVFLAALLVQEASAPEPMLPLHLFRNPIFTVAIVITCLASMMMTALVILIPLYYQLVSGLSPNEAGLRMIAMTLGSVTGSFLAGQAVTWTGRYRFLPIMGTSVATLMSALIALIGLGHSLLLDSAVTLLLGLAFGCQFSPMTVTVQNALEPKDGGIGVSCMMFFRLMGGAFGVALLSAILLGGLAAGAEALGGAAALGESPGLALMRAGHDGGVDAALLQALRQTARETFSLVFGVASAILAVALGFALALREVPLRGRE
ncbi:MFS transporter [Siccirubricoccus sp. G192]|uniref:MFS transporter n=1 Tax=Siccirubricoccus sp. G192 TaxID=2849651 RepID=UPI001C2B9ED6|nr:MFS transporter [Siccirubricoccus sp. G192]MBV1797384.1 MFS transporter [Siccirubricoccus sp. G192]